MFNRSDLLDEAEIEFDEAFDDLLLEGEFNDDQLWVVDRVLFQLGFARGKATIVKGKNGEIIEALYNVTATHRFNLFQEMVEGGDLPIEDEDGEVL
ncbi:MAG: hypothetical protein JW395_0044 [Nitrospira sp.]|nr:hypothetical protein [Nitrospira sp.]